MKKSNFFYRLVTVLLIGGTTLSCNGSLDLYTDCYESEAKSRATFDDFVFDAQIDEWIKEFKDPYTLENFQEAYENLYAEIVNSEFSSVKLLRATHYNIKFNPKNPEELALLNEREDGVAMGYVPFNVQVMPIEQASKMIKPTSLEENNLEGRYIYTPEPYYDYEHETMVQLPSCVMPLVWAVWPVDIEIPHQIEHEILYDVYLPQEVSHIGVLSDYIDHGLLESEAIRLAKNETNSHIQSLAMVYPSGYLIQTDNDHGGSDYLNGLKVVLNHGSKTSWVYTSGRGMYSFNSTWDSATQIKLQYEGTDHIISGSSSGAVLTHYLGTIGTTQGQTHRFASLPHLTMHRAAHWWVTGSHQLNKDLLSGRITLLGTPVIHPEGWLGSYDPGKSRSITIYYNSSSFNNNDAQLINTCCHEMGHAIMQRHTSHTYSSIDQSIREGWARFTGWYMTNL